MYHPDDKDLPVEQRREHPHHLGRRKKQQEAIEFFLRFTKTDIKHWAIENPVGVMNSHYRKPDQIVQPFWFGDSASKKTCLWTHNLPLLRPTKMVDPGERVVLSSGRSLPKWYSDSFNTKISTEERRRLRSKTFPGFAEALAEQWGNIE
jgi:hypothetical protein